MSEEKDVRHMTRAELEGEVARHRAGRRAIAAEVERAVTSLRRARLMSDLLASAARSSAIASLSALASSLRGEAPAPVLAEGLPSEGELAGVHEGLEGALAAPAPRLTEAGWGYSGEEVAGG
jgi:hypothetical protein